MLKQIRGNDLVEGVRRIAAGDSLLADGLTNRGIGEVIHLSEKTVKNYVSSIFAKLDVRRRAEAATYFVEHRTRDDRR